MRNHVPTLIVARPGRLRDGLRALLRATPGLELVGQADNRASALGLLRACHPALVLLDSNLPVDEVEAILRQTKTQYPHARCIVLANDGQQQGAARGAGADSVLLAGFPVTRFFAVVAELLSEEEPARNDGQEQVSH